MAVDADATCSLLTKGAIELFACYSGASHYREGLCLAIKRKLTMVGQERLPGRRLFLARRL